MTTRRKLFVTASIAVIVGGAVVVAFSRHGKSHRSPALVYTRTGYGGYVPRSAATPPKSRQSSGNAPVASMWDAYNAGHYAEVERVARDLANSPKTSPSDIAAVRSILAYSAARQHNFKLARERFGIAAKTAGASTRQFGPDGMPQPTVAEDAIYQHAVCTQALGDKAGAEAEFVAFIKSHADSPLVDACMHRITMLHGGDVPPFVEALYKQATSKATQAERKAEREASVCGPECVAEMLRRQAAPPASRSAAVDHKLVEHLADEMNTGQDGTTLDKLAAVAAMHGLPCEGMSLTSKGLARQQLPLIALLSTPVNDDRGAAHGRGHYVIVEAVSSNSVAVWDPDANGVGKPDRVAVPRDQWQHLWRGVALRFTKKLD